MRPVHPLLDAAVRAAIERAASEHRGQRRLAGYRDIAPVDPGFPDRRELWRLAAYLAVIAVDGHRPFGRRYLGRLAAAVQAYR